MGDFVTDTAQQTQQTQQTQQVSTGADNGNWIEFLPEDVRNWDEVKNADSPEKFWNQVKHMRARLGRSITLPTEDDGEEARQKFYEKLRKHVPDLIPMPKDPDEWDNVFRALGKPEKPDEYKVPEIDGLPEGFQLDQSKIEAFKQMAHEAGLTQRQFENVVAKYIGSELQQVNQYLEQEAQKMSQLKQEWGVTFDDRVKMAQAIREQYFPFLPKNLNSDMLKALVSVAEAMGKEPKDLADKKAKGDWLTPEEAELQLASIMKNKEHPYWNPSDPAHQAARKRVRQLTAIKLGEQLQ